MNWIIITTDKGQLTYCACRGNRLVREFKDIAFAIKYEEANEFKNSLNDFLAESKLRFEAQQRCEHFEGKIEKVNSTEFRALQRRLEKADEQRKLKDKQLRGTW
jgi:hypothetical protein